MSIFGVFKGVSAQQGQCQVSISSAHTPVGLGMQWLEDTYWDYIQSEKSLGFVFPNPIDIPNHKFGCISNSKDSSSSPLIKQRLKLIPLLSQGYTYQNNNFYLTEAGIIAHGYKDHISFYVDSRLYMGINEINLLFRDYEDIDVQNDSVTGSMDYASFSRTRANLNFDTQFGRFTLAKDAVQWGPSIYSGLSLNREAPPYFHFMYTGRWGLLQVISLYGDLTAGSSQGFADENKMDKNLYAHRFELTIGNHVLMGASEMLVMYNQNKPYLFTPILPLFSAKTNSYEENNNGAISADVTVKIPNRGLMYSEFFLDDLESPSSFITKNYSQNKWGFNLGAHFTYSALKTKVGSTLEYARIEPWVYTHFKESTSQLSHINQPLGNPIGPNSQQILWGQYVLSHSGYRLNSVLKFQWKGIEQGSHITDPYTISHTTRKDFLGKDPMFKILWEPQFQMEWKGFHWMGQGMIGDDNGIYLRMGYYLL